MGKFAQIQDIDLLSTLSDFTSKENWDKFFTIRGSHDSFEWYAEWPQLKDPLLSVLNAAAESPESLQILVPGCGNSRLSEQLYDAGFRGITNIDFSKVVISDMLRRNVRDRPGMRWRVMDMTNMQFPDAAFDVVLDKGGLDALMEPEIGPKLGTQYLSEVKRVLKSGGKFICLTLAESHVLGLLFPKFRLGWRTTIHSISQKLSGRPRLNTFMVVVEKDSSSSLHDIVSDFQQSDIDCKQDQVQGLYTALEIENRIRKEYVDGSNIAYSLEDLQLGTKGDLMELHPGQRIYLALGGQGESNFRYKAVLLDAQSSSDPFLYHCGIFFVPKSRSHEWLFSSEEGQWMVVERSKAARLIMILLDSSHTNISMEEIQKDLSSLVKQLAPQKHDKGAQIPFMMAGDGIMHRTAVHQATSKLTGPIKVEDVIYENIEDHLASLFPSKELVFRRLTFERTEGLVQSEALLLKESASMTSGSEARKYTATSKAKKRKQKLKESKQSMTNDLTGDVDVDHTFLASSYHTGIIGGFSLVSSYLQSLATAGRMVEVIIIGLGAGLLPMFLRRCMPFLHLEVVELDPVVLNLARDWFGFQEDECLKVHLGDGIQFLKKHIKVIDCKKEETTSNVDLTCPNGSYVGSNINGEPTGKVDVVIIDVDSSDSSSGLSCPAADFIEDAFLIAVKEVLSEQGLFVVNVVSRSSSIKSTVISRMKKVFSHLYCLQLEEDVNEVLFAVNTNSDIENGDVAEAASRLEKLLKFEQPERSRVIMDAAKKIKYLK